MDLTTIYQEIIDWLSTVAPVSAVRDFHVGGDAIVVSLTDFKNDVAMQYLTVIFGLAGMIETNEKVLRHEHGHYLRLPASAPIHKVLNYVDEQLGSHADRSERKAGV